MEDSSERAECFIIFQGILYQSRGSALRLRQIVLKRIKQNPLEQQKTLVKESSKECKVPLGRQVPRCEDNIKMDFKETVKFSCNSADSGNSPVNT